VFRNGQISIALKRVDEGERRVGVKANRWHVRLKATRDRELDSDAKGCESYGWARGDRKRPLNDGQIPNFANASTGCHRVRGKAGGKRPRERSPTRNP
jgi:hypothetical protein